MKSSAEWQASQVEWSKRFAINIRTASAMEFRTRPLIVEGGEQALQGPDVGRLDEVMIESGRARQAAVSLLAPAAERDQSHIAESRLLADAPGHLVPVHARHPDIQKHHRRL